MGLTGKFVIQIIWVVVAVGVIFTWLPIQEEREIREEGQINLGKALVNQFIQDTLQAHPEIAFLPDQEILTELIRRLASQDNIAYVILMDGSGRIKAQSGSVPEFPGDDLIPRQINEMVDEPLTTRDGKEFHEIFAPIIQTGQRGEGDTALDEIFGAVSPSIDRSEENTRIIRAGVDKDRIKASMQKSIRDKILLTAGIMIPALSLLVFIFIRNITRPLKEVAETVRSIARGNLARAEELTIDSHDEVGDLAEDVKVMANKLRVNREALEKLTMELEQKVQERTSELTEANRELAKANALLQELDKLKSEFLSTVSHELRTPLTSIKAFSEILLDDKGGDTDTQRRFLTIINNQTERLTRLIGDLLNLSRIESRKREWKKEGIDPIRIVEEAVRELSSLSKLKKISIETRQQAQIPVVFGSFDKLMEVVTNLLSNAMKFSPEGSGILISLFPGADTHGSKVTDGEKEKSALYVLLEVTDQGIGIPEESLESIFDRFYQVDPRKSKDMGGSGLGLAISKEIVDAHGGRIWVRSKAGEGSTFSFTIPSIHHPIATAHGAKDEGP